MAEMVLRNALQVNIINRNFIIFINPKLRRQKTLIPLKGSKEGELLDD